MKINFKNILTVASLVSISALSSCNKSADSPGYEYMPDMYRSPAIEAYVDYGIVKDKEIDSLTLIQSARIPAEGSIKFTPDESKAIYNFPFDYKFTTEDYIRATKELKNPIVLSASAEEQGKALYDKFCTHCHGKTGQGDGKVVEWGGFPSPGAYDKKYKNATEGQIFFTITYGKGMMGSHASQLNKEERWKVVHYVQKLINGGKSLLDDSNETVAEVESSNENLSK